jgi:muramoyltetrapeptide carboxypeptidase
MKKTRVGIPCPSDRPDMASVARGIEVLEGLDCEVVLGPELTGRPPRSSPYLREEERGDELEAMLTDPTLDVVWFADGGVGAYRLLPRLERFYRERGPENPPPMVGFSDNTFLLWHAAKWGHPAFYGPTVACVSDEEAKDLDHAVSMFQGRLALKELHEYADVVRPGIAKGTLLAGTFSVMAQMLGTPYCPPLDQAVLLLEEHGWNAPGEHEYLFWFQMQQIELAKSLDPVAGIVFGEIETEGSVEALTEGHSMPFPDIYTIMERSLPTCPVAGGFPWGRSKLGLLVPLGVPVTLTIGAGEVTVAW